MKVTLLLFVLWFTVYSARAQSGENTVLMRENIYPIDSLSPPIPPPNLYLKTNLFSLTEPDMAVTLAFEYRKSNEQSFQVEAGYIFLDALEEHEGMKHSNGFRIKPEWRFYTPGSPAKHSHYANYWALESIIKAVYNKFNRFVGRDCGSGACAYYQEMDYGTTRNVVGVGGKVGRESYIGQESKRVIVDFYAGLGVRYRWRNNSLPSDAHRPDPRGLIRIDRPTGFLPYISAGVKIGWRVK